MNQETRNKLERFAIKHKVVLEEKGTVGFGRNCVGFLRGNGYIDLNPYKSAPTFERVFKDDDYYYEPDNVPDAYHKHDCVAVLVHGEDWGKALRQLALWVDDLEANGAQLVAYKTGATGVQAIFSGFTGYAFRFSTPV